MRRRWLITLFLLVVVPTAFAFVRTHPRTLKPEECSELYRRYADSPDIRATYVKNYRVNDTLTLNATLLEATTDSGWAILLNDFKVPPYTPEMLKLLTNPNTVESKYVLHGTSDGPMDKENKENNDFVSISHFKHTIIVFDYDRYEQVRAIFYKQSKELKELKNI